MKSVVAVLGTRPEKVKLEPVFRALEGQFQVTVIETGQHDTLIDSTGVEEGDYRVIRIAVQIGGRALPDVLGVLTQEVAGVLAGLKPDMVLVQGDTISALSGALAARFSEFPVGHVEAGLRTFNVRSPWPEELVRKLIGQAADFHFAPTSTSRQNLIMEGVSPQKIFVTGNTSVDVVEQAKSRLGIRINPGASHQSLMQNSGPAIVTLHRRESHGDTRLRALRNLDRFLDANPGLRLKIVQHPNPSVVTDLEASKIGAHPRVELCAPLSHDEMVKAISESPFVISDSGGVQEEAPSLDRAVFIARDVTERPEAVDEGLNYLCGADLAGLEGHFQKWLASGASEKIWNPYGDSHAGEHIAAAIAEIVAV